MSASSESGRSLSALGGVAAVAVAVSLVVPVAVAREQVGDWVSVDALALLALAAAVPRSRWPAVAVFVVLGLWESARAVGASLMDQDPLLYDLVYLLRHLVVLGTDLLEGWFVPVVLGALLAVGLVHAVGGWALHRASREVPLRPVAALLALSSLAWALGAPARFSTVALGANLAESLAVRAEVRSMLRMPAYEVYDGLSLQRAPDLHVYIVESYGRILLRRPSSREPWLADARRHTARLQEAGYASVSGYLTAPVSGGRSWLADATLLTGRPIAHESVFVQTMGAVDGMRHLPGVLDAAGYETVLVRPKDRARPGVQLRNDLAFERPVFFADLGYEGPPMGWGWVPDQFTLGWMREHVLGAEGPPRFVFAHLVSSHAPWTDLPAPVDDWRTLSTPTGKPKGRKGKRPGKNDRWEEATIQLGRYQRREGHRGKRKASEDHLGRYADAVAYDLDVLVDHLLELPDRPGVFLLLGDHQPPLVARDEDFDVPVHVVSADPALLEPFRRHGFVPGWELPPEGLATLRMEGLMSLLLHTVAAAEGHELPVWTDGPTP